MKTQPLRVAIIGPESSGKSVLCENLAAHYNTLWVKEYSRIYLPKLNQPYSIIDIVKIYETQFKFEQEMIAMANNLLFIDTEYIIAKVWCESVFGYCPDVIESGITNHAYDFYLLTSPDLPWEYDPLRENPGKGIFYFDWYERILLEKNLKYGIVSGEGDLRLNNAISAIENFLSHSKSK